MATFLHPGIYVQELPVPQRIAAAATSNTAFVGMATAGPYDQPTLITSWNQFVATFGGFAWGMQMPFAVYAFFVQGGTACYVVRAGPANGDAMTPATFVDGMLIIAAASPGSWGDSIAITITDYPSAAPSTDTSVKAMFAINVLYHMPTAGPYSYHDQLVQLYATSNQLALLTLNGETYYQLETFPGYTANDLQKTEIAQQSNFEAKTNATSLFIRVAVTVTSATRPPNQTTPTTLRSGTGDPGTTPLQWHAALTSLDTVEDISLLVVPDTPSIPSLATQQEVVRQVVSYVEGRPRSDLFYLADPPLGLNVQEIVAWKTGGSNADVTSGVALHSSYATLYYPWLFFLNPTSSMNVPVPPSGTMAGTYAATDDQVGPWQVAAGITYGGLNIATGVTQKLTSSDQDVLNPAGINAILPFVGYGICAYGGRTMTTDPSLIYISVRRTIIQIAVSLHNGLQWVVFQPHTQQLWGTVTRDVTAFLTTMWQVGALLGDTAADAFQVQCDAGNNPPDLQAQDQLHVDIKLRLVFPPEFIVIRIQQATLGNI